jgi:hypothetical protein
MRPGGTHAERSPGPQLSTVTDSEADTVASGDADGLEVLVLESLYEHGLRLELLGFDARNGRIATQRSVVVDSTATPCQYPRSCLVDAVRTPKTRPGGYKSAPCSYLNSRRDSPFPLHPQRACASLRTQSERFLPPTPCPHPPWPPQLTSQTTHGS